MADVQRLRALVAAATPGEWAVKHGSNVFAGDGYSATSVQSTLFDAATRNDANAALIAAAINALPELLAIAEASEWREIESAPKDGTWVLLAGGCCDSAEDDNPNRVVTGQWTNYLNGRTCEWHWQFAWYDGGYYGAYDGPTHWRPLPKAPETQQSAGEQG